MPVRLTTTTTQTQHNTTQSSNRPPTKMAIDKIRPFNDPRITLRSALLNGHTYGYLHSPPSPKAPSRGTIVLIHGFPDISMGWRYQIPMLTSLGLEVIALDCLGYGRSSSPPSSSLSSYTYKRIADDIAALCTQLSLSRIILGGHDWGGAIVYRVQQYHPTLITAFFAICTPYAQPVPKYEPLQLLTRKAAPNFTYQLQFASGEVEAAVQSRDEIRAFLDALYGARTAEGEEAFVAEQGLLVGRFRRVGGNKLLSQEEMEYYVGEFARNGINGPLNWYRTRELNWVDDWDYFFDGGRNVPGKRDGVKVAGCEVLFVQAMRDMAIKPFMATKMAERVESLTWKKVDAGHWCLWQRPEECNAHIREWLVEKVFKEGNGKSKL